MIVNKIKKFKNILQQHLPYKSIKVSGNGEIEIICRFKPFEINNKDENKIDEIIKNIKNIIYILLNVKYKITKLQKSPELSYNKYIELINNSLSINNPSIKIYNKYLKYFKKENDKYLKSYSEIIIKLAPYKIMSKTDFILAINEMLKEETMEHV